MAEEDNAIRRVGRPHRDSATPPGTRTSVDDAKTEAPRKKIVEVPDEVRKRFVQVKRTYYFPDGTAAFKDRGNRLTTRSENTEVVKSLVEIAQARGWGTVEVSGSERFRREAWFAGSSLGLTVRGYEATEFERGRLARSLGGQAQVQARIAMDKESAPPNPPAKTPHGLLTGKLVDFGAAPYRDDPKTAMSYFVKLETAGGDRTVWGVDLERAMRHSLTKPAIGDEIGLRTVGKEAVKVKFPIRDGEGKVTGERSVEAVRNRWVIEKRGFFDERAAAAKLVRDAAVGAKEAVKQHPQLVGTYLQLHAAQLAAKRFRDRQDQALFVSKVRAALAEGVARGDSLPAVRLKDRAGQKKPDFPTRESELTR